MSNSIVINGIHFELLYKSVADNLAYTITDPDLVERHKAAKKSPNIFNSRDIVQFRSIKDGKNKILYAYRSSSELGIWRLGYFRAIDCALNKFELDYVQGTLLHHLLQGLINKKFIDLPLIPYKESKTQLHDMNPNNADHLISHNWSTLKREERKAFIESHRFIMFNFPTIEEEEAIDRTSRKIEMHPFSDISIKCDNKLNKGPISESLYNLSKQIKKYYTINPRSNKHINTYHFEEPKENILCVISIYTIELNTFLQENNVTLVYCKYTLVYGPTHTEVNGFYGIALLKTNESEVNEYGIYEKFIYAGIFICKPVIYIEKCDANASDLEERKCSKRYMYVGDRYNDIFPYSELHSLSGQARGQKKSKKRKSKKRSKKRPKKRSKSIKKN
jgi:hypothetical protein